MSKTAEFLVEALERTGLMELPNGRRQEPFAFLES
jgi:hypothetical protein